MSIPEDTPCLHKSIPARLRDMRRWMGTRFQPRKGQPDKTDKPPYCVRAGRMPVKADKTNPENWATFGEAEAAYLRGDVDAIGFVFTDSDPFFGLDFDGVVDTETGEIHPEADTIIRAFDSYAELSCSGRGVHVIGVGTKPADAKCKSRTLGFELEMYDGHSGARFLVMTGAALGGVAPQAEERQGELEELCRKLWPKSSGVVREAPGTGVLEDDDLLKRARRSKTGATFSALYDGGDTTKYASPSEADYALINALIFWTAGDRERVIRLFESSALYRDDKHAGYVATSVDNALSTYSGPYYRPRKASERRKSRTTPNPLTPYLRLLLDPSAWRGRRGASAFKAYAGAVTLAHERGIVDDDGNLRIGCDTRTLSETCGMSRSTLQESALPYLMKEMKLLRWQRGKRGQAGQFVLVNPESVLTRSNKVSTHFNGPTWHNPENALETLRLLIRMRSGRSKKKPLARLGMVAMFALVALCSNPSCGQTLQELSERTGRRKPDLRRVLAHLVKGGVVVSDTAYRLAPDFRVQYERELERTGIVYSEGQQRKRHKDERRERDKELLRRRSKACQGAKCEEEPQLKGPEEVGRIVAERAREEQERRVEEERRKVGVTAAVFVADELRGVTGMHWQSMRARWLELGGRTEALWQAVRGGPYRLQSEGPGRGEMYVYHEARAEGAA